MDFSVVSIAPNRHLSLILEGGSPMIAKSSLWHGQLTLLRASRDAALCAPGSRVGPSPTPATPVQITLAQPSSLYDPASSDEDMGGQAAAKRRKLTPIDRGQKQKSRTRVDAGSVGASETRSIQDDFLVRKPFTYGSQRTNSGLDQEVSPGGMNDR